MVARPKSTRHLARTDFSHPGSADTQSDPDDLLSSQEAKKPFFISVGQLERTANTASYLTVPVTCRLHVSYNVIIFTHSVIYIPFALGRLG